jgi:hypothetical protein
MSFFPESLMPSNLKQESDDFGGNPYVISAEDFNIHDEEIRAIEKAIGVPKLTVPGFGSVTDNCSLLSLIENVLEKLVEIRDDFIQMASGVVAVKDSAVFPTPNGQIPFPSDWYTTIKAGIEIPDDSDNDEDELEKLPDLALVSVTGFPDEGYITVINDVSVAPTLIIDANVSELLFISPEMATGKIGKEFVHEFLTTLTSTISITDILPSGLTLSNNFITGNPTEESEIVITVTATRGSTAITQLLTIKIYPSGPPTIINDPLSLTVTEGQNFYFPILFEGNPTSITTTGLPAGVTQVGSIISGTPREQGVYDIEISIEDDFGDSSMATFVLTVD